MAARDETIEAIAVGHPAQPARADVQREEEARGARSRGARTLIRVLLVGLSILFVFPFVYLILSSLESGAAVFDTAIHFDALSLENYRLVVQEVPMVAWTANSFLVGILAAGTVVFSSALVAFAFAYFEFPGKKFLFAMVLATMMLPGAVTMIPTFLIWDALGWVNTHVPLWAHNVFGSAFYIFLLRQFFLTLPRDVLDAARVDGANPLQIWWHVAIPMCRPALIVVAIFEFKASWTDLIKPLIYLQAEERFTLPLGLKAILDQFGPEALNLWGIVLAGSVIITVPMLLAFFFGQRYFIEGINITGARQ